MNIVMRNRIVALAVAATFAAPVMADVMDWLKGAGGAAVGAIAGNQVGQGKGRTAATAAGAVAGSVIASGCKVSVGTAVGGVAGGVVGAQMGQGRGKDAMAAIGATVGAWLGSDCSPVASASAPVALSGDPFRFNGLVMTPMSGFPLEAFQGVPPMVTTDDLAAGREVAKRLASSAEESYQAGDTESAMLKMYWAKRIGQVALSTAGQSLAALNTLKVAPQRMMPGAARGQLSGSSVTVSVPPKTLVVLPAFDQEGAPQNRVAQLWESTKLGRVDMADGVKVADLGVAGILGALKQVTGAQQRPQQQSQQQGSGQLAYVPPELLGLENGRVLRMENGASVMKSPGNLTVYNPGDKAVTIPLDKLDYMPRTPMPSADRQAAGDLLKAMNENVTRWTFGEYKRQTMGSFWTKFQVPNRIVDAKRGNMVIGYTDSYGNVVQQRMDGDQAYKSDANYRLVANVMDGIGKSPAVNGFSLSCQAEALSFYDVLGGQYSNTLTQICFKGNFNNGQVNQIATRTFWIGENGKAVQTLESIAQDKDVVSTMKKALTASKTVSDAASLTGTAFGNVESALQCFDKYTLAQMAAVEGVRASGGLKGNTTGFMDWDGAASGYKTARLAGWEPDQSEWSMDRVANCVGAIPVAGAVGKRVAMLGKDVLAKAPDLERLSQVFKAFETPTSFNDYAKGVSNVADLYPSNPAAASFVKSIYDGLMTGQGLVQIKQDIAEYRAI